MARRHYHVVENTPGYMPDSDPSVCRTLVEAGDYAHFLAQSLRDDGYRVWGNKRDGYQGERDNRDLGRVIEIIPCDEDRPECLEAFDDD